LIIKKLGIERVDLIKIDVEGSELEVFGSVKKTLKRVHSRIMVEVRKETVKAFCVSQKR